MRDDGLTLVELLVYSILLAMVLLIVGSIMISTLGIERIVRESTTTTSDAQLAATAIEAGVRNSTAVQLTDIGDDQLLVARTAGTDPATLSWRCEAWYFSKSAGTIRTTATTSDSAPITVPASEPTSWTLLASNIEPPASGVTFTHSGNSVTIYFQGITADAQPVDIRSSSVVRAGAWESASCF